MGNRELRITNYELRITNYELRITNYEWGTRQKLRNEMVFSLFLVSCPPIFYSIVNTNLPLMPPASNTL